MGLKTFIKEQKRKDQLKEEFISLLEELKAIEEKSKSKSQQRFMGMVHQCKKNGECPSEEVKDAAESMTGKEAKDFAKTKHKGLPEKVDEAKKRKKKNKQVTSLNKTTGERERIGNISAGEHGEHKKSPKYKRRKDKQKGFDMDEGKKPGLWDNIRAKRERGEPAAKPGDEDYPDKKSWNKAVKASESEEYLEIEEAEYQGRDVTLNKPFRTPDGPKKFSVYVKDGDKVKKVNFGSPDMEIKRDNPERRKSFRARHNCDEKKDKTKAGYWSCRQWRKGAKVEDSVDHSTDSIELDEMAEKVFVIVLDSGRMIRSDYEKLPQAIAKFHEEGIKDIKRM